MFSYLVSNFSIPSFFRFFFVFFENQQFHLFFFCLSLLVIPFLLHRISLLLLLLLSTPHTHTHTPLILLSPSTMGCFRLFRKKEKVHGGDDEIIAPVGRKLEISAPPGYIPPETTKTQIEEEEENYSPYPPSQSSSSRALEEETERIANHGIESPEYPPPPPPSRNSRRPAPVSNRPRSRTSIIMSSSSSILTSSSAIPIPTNRSQNDDEMGEAHELKPFSQIPASAPDAESNAMKRRSAYGSGPVRFIKPEGKKSPTISPRASSYETSVPFSSSPSSSSSSVSFSSPNLKEALSEYHREVMGIRSDFAETSANVKRDLDSLQHMFTSLHHGLLNHCEQLVINLLNQTIKERESSLLQQIDEQKLEIQNLQIELTNLQDSFQQETRLIRQSQLEIQQQHSSIEKRIETIQQDSPSELSSSVASSPSSSPSLPRSILKKSSSSSRPTSEIPSPEKKVSLQVNLDSIKNRSNTNATIISPRYNIAPPRPEHATQASVIAVINPSPPSSPKPRVPFRELEVIHDFTPSGPEQLTQLKMQKGDLIYLIQKHPSDWWFGQNIQGQRGWFPKSFVALSSLSSPREQEQDGSAASPSLSPQSDTRASQIYIRGDQKYRQRDTLSSPRDVSATISKAFNGKKMNEVSVKKGDRVKILTKRASWTLVELVPSGAKGYVPTHSLKTEG